MKTVQYKGTPYSVGFLSTKDNGVTTCYIKNERDKKTTAATVVRFWKDSNSRKQARKEALRKACTLLYLTYPLPVEFEQALK